MENNIIKVNNINVEVVSLNTAIVGSGAAGFNAADRLYTYGQKDIAIITEGINMGTSRNTGSDKQTYYKLTLAGDSHDSIFDMAKTLFDGGSMEGDIALVEAALSTQAFYHLVDIGVPFPHNKHGEYIGYKTDHDPRQRATSAGPLTSKYMTERLEEQIIQKNIKIYDGYQVIGIITSRDKDETIGLLTLNLKSLDNIDNMFVAFNCTNIVYATGGPAGIYSMSVYPESQTGASGLAFEAGIKGKNVTESQYGIASTKFRWNLSGTYQQVLPRYVSTDMKGNDEKDFLEDYFKDAGTMLDAIFLKGYQWPFDPSKIKDFGSSLIDILVYNETIIKGRRVFLDFTKNPSCSQNKNNFNFSLLGEESYTYLKNSKALFGKPIDRLKHMNQPAIDLYMVQGIDITKEYLEIAVCAQHNNGGLYGDMWWQSNLKHFFPVGEVNGSHGVYRPGGSALNSGQVGSTRAAQYISSKFRDEPINTSEFYEIAKDQISSKIDFAKKLIGNMDKESNINKIRKMIGDTMNRQGAHIRSLNNTKKGIEETKEMIDQLDMRLKISSIHELPYGYQIVDMLITQYVYLSAIADYVEKGGRSRGSYLIEDESGILPVEGVEESFRFTLDNNNFKNKIQEVIYKDGKCHFVWKDIKEIPKHESWFENVWNDYMKGDIIN